MYIIMKFLSYIYITPDLFRSLILMTKYTTALNIPRLMLLYKARIELIISLTDYILIIQTPVQIEVFPISPI